VTPGSELILGAVDLYVHAAPDLLPRRADDLGLARECLGAGYRTAVHRHHFASTVERATLATSATGFDLRGAVLLNDAVGGLNPSAVELALLMGGRWIGMPTLSAAFHRSHMPAVGPELRSALEFGPGQLRVVDDSGQVSDEVREILQLCATAGAVLNVGYVSPSECEALIASAPAGSRLVATNPHTSMRQDAGQISEMALRGVTVELTAYSMHPAGPGRRDPKDAVDAAARVIRLVGVERCALSSDGGMANAPGPGELLGWLADQLLSRGFSPAELTMLTIVNPSRLLDS